LNSGFKTKGEEIQLRRAKILELKAQGQNQEELAQTLNVPPVTITFDLHALSDEAKEYIRDYTTRRLPLQIRICFTALEYVSFYQTVSCFHKDIFIKSSVSGLLGRCGNNSCNMD
jgi:hypothetical protein